MNNTERKGGKGRKGEGMILLSRSLGYHTDTPATADDLFLDYGSCIVVIVIRRKPDDSPPHWPAVPRRRRQTHAQALEEDKGREAAGREGGMGGEGAGKGEGGVGGRERRMERECEGMFKQHLQCKPCLVDAAVVGKAARLFLTPRALDPVSHAAGKQKKKLNILHP